jgi:hypothetical protein
MAGPGIWTDFQPLLGPLFPGVRVSKGKAPLHQTCSLPSREAFPDSCDVNFDGLVKSRNSIKIVIPAKAGIQLFQDVLDPGFRRGDASRDFLRDHQLSCLF